jgi:hypothetical protein
VKKWIVNQAKNVNIENYTQSVIINQISVDEYVGSVTMYTNSTAVSITELELDKYLQGLQVTKTWSGRIFMD